MPQTWQNTTSSPRLNQNHFIPKYSFTEWEGEQGQKDINPDSEEIEYPDISELYQRVLNSIDEQLELLRQSQGRLGQLLRLHWPDLEVGYRTLKRHVREFVLQHQSEEVYMTQLSEPFKAHLASWRLELGLLWLELEEQSR